MLVVGLTIAALLFVRPHEADNLARRTADWATVEFSDVGLGLKYPAELQLVTGGDAKAVLRSADAQVEIKLFPNPDQESSTAWLDRMYASQSQEIELSPDVRAARIETSDMQTVTVLQHDSRIIEITTQLEDQIEQDLFDSLFLAEVPSVEPAAGRQRMLVLTDIAFRELYNSLKLPDTKAITDKPSITGDAAADAHIQMLAEARGYRLQAEVTSELTEADGYSIHPTAAAAWRELQAAAKEDGIALSITSGFRGIASQQQIFTSRLATACSEVYGTNCTNDQIAAGNADEAIDQVLVTSSIPGYSRHHTGYTVDIGHVGVGAFEDFFGTPGWDWMVTDNYANAKRFGFIPSYPPGAGVQGPDPEPWEYVYVGANFFRIGE